MFPIDAENKSVVETDNITLKCYAVNAKDVTWMHDNERVLHFKTDGSINPGKGYEGRASLAKDCFKTGDLSLTIAGVRIEDAGIYRCFVDDETVKGNPHACVLLVNGKTGKSDCTVELNIACHVTGQLRHNNNLVHFPPYFYSEKSSHSL